MQQSGKILSYVTEVRRTARGGAYQADHAHYQLEFNFILSGKGCYLLDDGHHDLVPGTVVWLLPGQHHRLMRSPDMSMWVATISPAELDEEFLQDVAAKPCSQLSSQDAIALDRLLSHHSQDSDDPRLYLAGLAYVFRSALHACQTSPGATRRPMHPAVIRTLQILRSGTDAPGAAELARICGVSQAYLGQLLSEQTGLRLVELRNRARLEQFHILYPKSGDLLTAALEAGFGSYTQFHRVFSEMIGMTPGEWAKAGEQAQVLSFPSAADVLAGTSGESGRMIWYALAELALPTGSRWFGPDFARYVVAPDSCNGVDEPIPNGINSIDELRAYMPMVLEQARAAHPAHAARLDRAFQRNDLLALHQGSLGSYGLGYGDVAVLITTYIALAWMGTNNAPIPTVPQIQKLLSHVRRAVSAIGMFRSASLWERQLATAAIIAQTSILRAAVDGCRGSGNDTLVQRINMTANNTLITSLGVDVKQHRLVF
ncbi:AraC family transcriptional regulator [Sandaracinobacter sp. RS1-74]|uniref:helix-turn-helix domain-containing protein n=1 Tax=Sandaracinobacteroides sayramensis TaxID=2913411 RepID=UPI001EDC30B7|nr:helix-turn-helix domain-containing protein [Sandaracinobacteroides sayramensis]MCG2840180.1 AraC family transcriptional regulator [Sandaracinobacteroides sayramensis]